jgi:AraC-like DNA-binding protein
MLNELQIVRLPFKSIEDMQHVIHGADLDSVQLKPNGTPKGGILYASAGEVVLTTGQFYADIRSRGVMDKDRVTLGVHFSSNASLSEKGIEALSGDIFAFAPGSEQDGKTTGDISYATVSINPATLLKIGANDAVIGNLAFWEQRPFFRATPDVRATISSSLIGISSQLMGREVSISDKQMDIFQHELIELFLRGIVFDERQRVDRLAYSGVSIVRKVEDWVRERKPESVHISDICKALYVSRRTLQRAFTETLGMGPAHYLMLKRLSAVRSILRTTDPETTSVSKVAMDHGFWELGRFTLIYKRMFGEKPSDTLHRQYRSLIHIGNL